MRPFLIPFCHLGSHIPSSGVKTGRVNDGRCAALPVEARPGFHGHVPDQPSPAKVAPVECHLATMILKIKTITIPKGRWHGRSCHSIWDVSVSGQSCTKLGDFLGFFLHFFWYTLY